MAHWNQEARWKVISLIEHGEMTPRQAGVKCGVPATTAKRWWRRFQEIGEARRRPGTGRVRVSTAADDARLVAASTANPFLDAERLVKETAFPGCGKTARNRLREANLFSRQAAVKAILTGDNKIDRMAFAATHQGENWDNVIFSDEKTFSSSDDGPLNVFRPPLTSFHPDDVHQRQSSGRFSVCGWGWISAAGGGVLWRVDHKLTGPRYRDILEHVLLPSVRILYPNGPIRFQQGNSLIHHTDVVQQWFQAQPDVDSVDWIPCAADLNPIENVWAEVVRTMKENWEQPQNQAQLWEAVETAWLEVTANFRYMQTLIASMPRRLNAVLEAEGGWTAY